MVDPVSSRLLSDSEALLGRTIGRYRLEELVGAGAMGDVYRGRHVGLGNDVAIKIMRPSIAGEPKFKERFYREAKAASLLVHPNSVRVIDFGEEPDGLVYLIMEFLRGRDLLAVLRAEWPLPDERIVDILSQTLAAVSVAHQNGIVHRDLKPENIMIVPDDDEGGRDHVKVCDFGIAKLADARAFKSKEDITTALTAGNSLVGTPEYMSPEQARGEPLDARSDLYSIGVILYQLMTRELPFNAENAIGLAVKHIVEEVRPPSAILPHVSARLEAICMRAMQKDPNARFATAKEMRRELRAAIERTPSSAGSLPVASPSNPGRHTDSFVGAATISDGSVNRTSGDAPTHGNALAAYPPTHLAGAPAIESEPRLEPYRPPATSPRALVLALLLGVGAVGVYLIVSSQWSKKAPSTESSTSPSVSSPTVMDTPAYLVPAAATLSAAPSVTASSAPAPTQAPAQVHSVATTPAAPHTPSAQPSLPVPPPSSQPAPTASASVAAPPDVAYQPNHASVTLGSLTAMQVDRALVSRKMSEIVGTLNGCYRDALVIAGRPVDGVATINMSVDPTGHVVTVVSAPLPQFQRCVALALRAWTLPSSAVDPAGGTAEQTVILKPSG